MGWSVHEKVGTWLGWRRCSYVSRRWVWIRETGLGRESGKENFLALRSVYQEIAEKDGCQQVAPLSIILLQRLDCVLLVLI